MLEYEIINETNHIGGVMVSVLASSVVDREFKPWSDKTKHTITLVFVTSPLSTQLY